jgi:hypothetical protein
MLPMLPMLLLLLLLVGVVAPSHCIHWSSRPQQ